MILENTIKMTWNGRNKTYYENLGYKYTKQREEFDLNIKDLIPTSHYKIHVACDICDKDAYVAYRDYINRTYDEYLCSDCATRKYGVKHRIEKHIQEKSISFGDWCRNNIDEDFISKYWDIINTEDPYRIAYASNKIIYLHCDNTEHVKYETTCDRFTLRGQRCPQCAQEQEESKLQEAVKRYIRSNYSDLILRHEFNCSIAPINPVTGCRLRYDNCIEDIKLVIEVHGIQHYQVTSWAISVSKNKGTTPDQELEYQQWKDAYKKQYALDNGYEYLEIPYWTEKDESYKILIDNKIKEILGSSAPPIKMKPRYRAS